MKFLNWKTNKVRADTTEETTENIDGVLLQTLLGRTSIGKDEVKQIPELNACIDLIAGTVASMPIKLYKQNEDSVEEVKEDTRVDLLNKNTKDTLTSKQFWRAMIEDYYLAVQNHEPFKGMSVISHGFPPFRDLSCPHSNTACAPLQYLLFHY